MDLRTLRHREPGQRVRGAHPARGRAGHLALAVVDRVAPGADAGELGQQASGEVIVCSVCAGMPVRLDAGPGRRRRTRATAAPCRRRCSAASPARPTSVNIRIECGDGDLRDVDDGVAVEHRHVARLAELVDQPPQVRARPDAEQPAGRLAEPDQPRPERVAPGRLLADVADGRPACGSAGGWSAAAARVGGRARRAQRATGVGQPLEQLERPVDGLHATRLSVSHGAPASG